MSFYGFEPVNLVTGSVLYEGVDFSFPGALPLEWKRVYHSDSNFKGLIICSASLPVEERSNEHVIKRTYDKSGQIATLTSSLGADLTYERNEFGELTCFSAEQAEAPGRFESRHEYDSLGFELERMLPGGVTQSFAYDDIGRLIDNIQYFFGLPKEQQQLILDSKLLVYVCEGEERKVKEWFKTINIVGVPLNEQGLRNAIYSGPFVSAAKRVFSNSQNVETQKWSHYVKGDVKRQEYLRVALEWVSVSLGMTVDAYMSKHRRDEQITELETYFRSVIDWVATTFTMADKTMCGLEWGGRLYDMYSGKLPQSQRGYRAMIGGKQVNGIADHVVDINGKNRTIEAKYVKD